MLRCVVEAWETTQDLSRISTETATDKRQILGLEEKAMMFVVALPELKEAGTIKETAKGNLL